MSDIQVEVVFAMPDEQRLETVTVASGASVADAIDGSSLQSRFPDTDLGALKVGVWGHLVTREHILSAGDRIEIYRPLELDPREARRQLATLGRTMGSASRR